MKRLIVSMLALLMAMPMVLASKQYVVECKSRLNVRMQPSTSAQVLGVVENGQRVEVLEISDGWAKISFNGKKAYISAKYISPTKEKRDKNKKSDSLQKWSKEKEAVWSSRLESIEKFAKNKLGKTSWLLFIIIPLLFFSCRVVNNLDEYFELLPLLLMVILSVLELLFILGNHNSGVLYRDGGWALKVLSFISYCLVCIWKFFLYFKYFGVCGLTWIIGLIVYFFTNAVVAYYTIAIANIVVAIGLLIYSCVDRNIGFGLGLAIAIVFLLTNISSALILAPAAEVVVSIFPYIPTILVLGLIFLGKEFLYVVWGMFVSLCEFMLGIESSYEAEDKNEHDNYPDYGINYDQHSKEIDDIRRGSQSEEGIQGILDVYNRNADNELAEKIGDKGVILSGECGPLIGIDGRVFDENGNEVGDDYTDDPDATYGV